MLLRIAIFGLTLKTIQALGEPPRVDGINDFAKRQGVQFPPQCQSACSSIQSTLNKCSPDDFKCLCKKSVERATFDCLECTIQIAGPLNQEANVETAQTILNQLIEGCQNAGFSLPATTITSFTEFPSATAGVIQSESLVGSGTMLATTTNSPVGNPGGFSGGPTPTARTDGTQATATSIATASNGAIGWKTAAGAVNGPISWILLFNVALALPV
ncbi:hypothetical protein M407DRAFT_112021 [Tulasnella calospora MUT 4182]|uniref:Extracellular membrane protein CFEM domain-containing protein n=1 Tax=Tulasnella calospora MUT 4182 TaxID=1051891 RepID=A0A0C3LE85_9AGAM|nr:hypothetical protein M407DRAFT_112021 [Tulasnella calospora MUT 4182]